MDFITQIGGKYHAHNKPLFKLKRRLEAIGIKVNHPLSEEFINQTNTAPVYDPAVFSVYNVAFDYYQSLVTCDFHIVCNSFEDNHGYVGENAAREILYAMLKRRPVILLYEPRLKQNINHFTRDILARHKQNIRIKNLLDLSDDGLTAYLKEVASTPVQYQLSQREQTLIRSQVRAYFREVMSAK